jgi:hypothetical protein
MPTVSEQLRAAVVALVRLHAPMHAASPPDTTHTLLRVLPTPNPNPNHLHLQAIFASAEQFTFPLQLWHATDKVCVPVACG